MFFVRKDDEIFRPYISRSFDLANIIRRVKTETLESYPPEITGYLTAPSIIDIHLNYYARLLKKHGKEILNGDLSVFEYVHTMRKDSAK